MDLGTAMVVVAGIGAWYSLRSKGLTGRSRGTGTLRDGSVGPAVGAAFPSRREDELQKEVEHLRERIQVLERIATEGRTTRALADEIESLREPAGREH